MRPRVVILRGHQVNPWELRQWEELPDRFEVSYLRSGVGWFDDSPVDLPHEEVGTLRARLPRGRMGDLLVRVPGDRYLGLEPRLASAAIVHSQELGYWYSAQAARLKAKLGFKLVVTIWETIPFLDAYRNVRTRRYRRVVLRDADLFLAATDRARAALILEGADPARIRVAPPGIDIARFGRVARQPPARHVILSPGRLVWEKGHQDLLRAVAALRRGLVELPQGVRPPQVLIVGAGPEEARLRRYATELGLGEEVEWRASVPYGEMPEVFARASCMVLASLPVWSWEEQFGMVLAEAMAVGLPIIASSCGAIPEVVGPAVSTVAPGDWLGLARALSEGPLAEDPGRDRMHDAARLNRYGAQSAARRLEAAYDEVLST